MGYLHDLIAKFTAWAVDLFFGRRMGPNLGFITPDNALKFRQDPLRVLQKANTHYSPIKRSH